MPETTFATARRELPAPPVVHPTGAPARAFEVVDSRIVAATNRAQLDPVTGNRAYDLTRAASRSHIWTLHSWGRRELGPSRYAPVQTSWREYDPRRGGHPMTFHAFDSNS